jgi:hypothetical protein
VSFPAFGLCGPGLDRTTVIEGAYPSMLSPRSAEKRAHKTKGPLITHLPTNVVHRLVLHYVEHPLSCAHRSDVQFFSRRRGTQYEAVGLL